jgi:hypothetical protein
MKITVNQLRKIIKEEISKSLNEVVNVDLPTELSKETIMTNLQGTVNYAKRNRRSLHSVIQSIESGDWKYAGMLKDFEALKIRGEIDGDPKEALISKIAELWNTPSQPAPSQPDVDKRPSEPEDIGPEKYIDRIYKKRSLYGDR